MQKIKASPVLLIIGIFLLLGSLLFNSLNTLTLKDLALKAGNKISKKSNRSIAMLKLLQEHGLEKERVGLYNLYNSEKIGIYLFRQ